MNTDQNTILTPADAEKLTPGQWVFDANDTALCLVDTHMGWPQRMFMTRGGSSFTSIESVDYPLHLADIADETPCPHRWGFNECGHCKRCGVVVGESRPLFFDPAGQALVQAAAEHNARLSAEGER